MNVQAITAGGFLAGKKTYILVALAVLTELARWAVGEQSLGALVEHLPGILGELSIATVRLGIAHGYAAQEPHRQAIEALLKEMLDRAEPTPPHPDAVREWIEGRRNRS
jgi:hypothetical protein